jgi:predicted regulator of Ras-like GTPase activity (Roadblock/LC7/MglB family)
MSEQGTPSPERDLGWLLDDLAARVDQFRQAVILSRDGLVIAASRDLSREDAEHMAALAAGLQSLAKGAGEHYGVGAVRQCVIELEQALLFVTSAGHGSCLAVLCPADADAGRAASGGAAQVPDDPQPGGLKALWTWATTSGSTGIPARSFAPTR